MARFLPKLDLLWLVAWHHNCNRDMRKLLVRRGYRVVFEEESEECRLYRVCQPPPCRSIGCTILRQVETYDDEYAKRSLQLCYWVNKSHSPWLWVIKV
jgi:hypothetical protein